jgi:hypothetical protein
LDKEAPVPTVQTPRRETVHADPKITDAQRLKDEYGDKAITDMTLRQLSARYFVFTHEQMDDDDVIDMIAKKPTFSRRPDFRNQIKERQLAASNERPVEVPKSSKRPATGDSQTIDFGEN